VNDLIASGESVAELVKSGEFRVERITMLRRLCPNASAVPQWIEII
jgi:hypothetical protein